MKDAKRKVMADVAWDEMVEAWKEGTSCEALDSVLRNTGTVDYSVALKYSPALHLKVLDSWEKMTGGKVTI